MLTLRCDLKSLAPLYQSAPLQSARNDGESADAHDERVWKERMHVDEEGICYVPAMAMKWALDWAAGFLNIKIPGERNATWKKQFVSGILITDNLSLGVRAADVKGERVFVNADGKRGSGTRVWRRFPRIDSWSATLIAHIINPKITPDVFERHLVAAGNFNGLGSFRVQNGNVYGRFEVKSVKES